MEAEAQQSSPSASRHESPVSEETASNKSTRANGILKGRAFIRETKLAATCWTFKANIHTVS